MATFRIPGPICQVIYPDEVDDGTLCRAESPLPGPLDDCDALDAEGDVPRVLTDSSLRTDGLRREGSLNWRVYDEDEEWPGTNIPRTFLIDVSGWVFFVNANATKHMMEYAAARSTGPGTFDAQLTFPMSALAAGLETVISENLLTPLLTGQTERLGTEERPLNVSAWQFSFEYRKGMGIIELLHAVPIRA